MWGPHRDHLAHHLLAVCVLLTDEFSSLKCEISARMLCFLLKSSLHIDCQCTLAIKMRGMAMEGMGEESLAVLVESRKSKGGIAYRLFASTIFVGICLIWMHRIVCMPRVGEGRVIWVGMFLAELFFGLYWICTQSARWNVVIHCPFKDRLSQKYKDEDLPGVDIFVCTADPILEPPIVAINSVLSLMSYIYPPEKLSVYLSDDGGSDLTFYALLEASHFSKLWIPFCKRHGVEPRSPEAYFAQVIDKPDKFHLEEWLTIKKLYEEMKDRIQSATEAGKISEKARDQHKGFSEWSHYKVTKGDHQPIVQIIIDGRDPSEVDIAGSRLPTLVYMSREKRPQYPHNFKAGAMNSLIRVSSEISNGSIILNMDCDMYANDSDTVREALCFFMDEDKGHEIAFVQHPQTFHNITLNDLCANVAPVINKVELAGLGGYGAALYCGTGCFHRREGLSGKKPSMGNRHEKWDNGARRRNSERTVTELEDASKVLASCSYELDTQWGKEMGLVYGCPVEDLVTGLVIQCRGWKSVYYNPEREAFLGLAPNTLDAALIQYKRWSEGMFQIFLSKYCPFVYGHGKIDFGAQMGYCIYLLWAPLSLPTLYCAIVVPLCLLRGIPIFPQVSSLWFVPFAYVCVTRTAYSIAEAWSCGCTLRRWWNSQRMLLIRRTTAYPFAFIDTIIKQLGLSHTKFAVTPKVITEDVLKRYEEEIMEFGSSATLMFFTILATLAMLNLFSFLAAMAKRFILDVGEPLLIPEAVLCGLVVVMNVPVYEAIFIRSDKGNLPTSVMLLSLCVASLACLFCLV